MVISLILSLVVLAQMNFVVSLEIGDQTTKEVASGSETESQNTVQPRVFNARQSRLSKFLTKLKPSNKSPGKQDSNEESKELGASVGRFMGGVGAGR